MKATKKQQLQEANKRLATMRAQGYQPEVINEAGPAPKGEQFPLVSEASIAEVDGYKVLYGTLFTLEEYAGLGGHARADAQEVVKEFEDEYNAVVYAITAEPSPIDPSTTWLDLFYISDEPDEWDMDNADLEEQEPLVYVSTEDIFSEFGRIRYECRVGGLVRTA